ncbi:DNA-3-methyladenine glycosylase family protein [Pseudomonas sp. LRF_L74]|uniref:DNA-3-methyladenine glycosylase family protein n=1 Tax=Pseudomonas sp. LRF_L74 TaxID=3369422 RepID=UPI003F5F6E12
MTDSYRNAEIYLSQADADLAGLIARVGPCLLEPKTQREPYEALVRAVAYQQLHARAAEAMLARLLTLFPGQDFPGADQLSLTSPEVLRGCGFSGRKAETIHGIASGVASGLVPSLEEAARLNDGDLVERLTALRGIGRWTVEMLLIYSLQRMDILPVDDFGIREGYRRLKGLGKAPSPRQLRDLTEPWQPWRSVASWYLWRAAEGC